MSRLKKYLGALLLGLGLCQTVALADVVTMKLVGEPSGFTQNGVYTSPYNIQVNSTNPALALVCDDFDTHITNGEMWNAKRILLADVENDPPTDNGPQKFHGTNIVDDYFAAAWLSLHIIDNWQGWKTNNNQLASAEYSFAVWSIFTPSALTGTSFTSTQKSEIDNIVQYARDATTDSSFDRTTFANSVYIYTPTPNAAVAQEFIGRVPEASTLAFLALFGFIGALFLVTFARRRSALSSGLLN